MADLTTTTQRAYVDPEMSAHVADMVQAYSDVLADIADCKAHDLTDLLTRVRDDPDMAGAAVLAALAVLPDTPGSIARMRMQAGAIRRWTQPEQV